MTDSALMFITVLGCPNAVGQCSRLGRWLAVAQISQALLLRSWQSLREGNGVEDMLVRQWLIFSPPMLHDVVVWTGARKDQGRLVNWHLDNGRGVWRKANETVIMRDDYDNAPFY